MALTKLVNLFALSSLAIVVCSFGASPVAALSDPHHMRMVKRAHGHDLVAKRKRTSNGKRCKPKSSSAALAPTPTPNQGNADPSSTQESSSKPSPTSSGNNNNNSNNTGGSNGGSGGGAGGFTNPGSNRVGLAWPNGNDPSLSNFVTGNTKFIYTWSESCPDKSEELGLQCMPMLWNGAGDKVSKFKSTVKKGYANIAVGFNEVNEPGQANMDPGTAVSVWKDAIEPLKDQGYTLLSPCTSSNPNGLTWMKQWFDQCNGGCSVDGIPLHFYGTSAQDFIDYVNLWHTTFNKPIWVTEFACQNFNTANENNGQQCSQQQVQEFYSTAIKFLEQSDFVVAYFAFGIMHDMQGVNPLDQLMAGNGQPTALGKQFINVQW